MNITDIDDKIIKKAIQVCFILRRGFQNKIKLRRVIFQEKK